MKPRGTIAALICLASFSLFYLSQPSVVRAATALYFNAEGGTKTWDYTSLNWSTDPGPPYDKTWVNNYTAIFEGTAGTVDVSENIKVSGITFLKEGYTIGSTPNSGTLVPYSTSFNISTSTGIDTINSVISNYTTFPGTELHKTGTGTLVLNGENTLSGRTYIYSGTVKLGNTNALVYSDVILNGGTLNFGSLTNVTLGGLFVSYGQSLSLTNQDSSAVALTVGNNTSSCSGVLSGSGSLTKAGASIYQLVGPGYTYTGDTKVAGGTLTIAAPLWGSTLDYDNYGGEVRFDNASSIIGGLKGNQDLLLPSSGVLYIGANDKSTTYDGVFHGGYESIGKIGAGTLTLTGASTHSNPTIVSSGILKLANPNALQYSSVYFTSIYCYDNINSQPITYSGGTLSFGSLDNAIIGGLYGSVGLILQNDYSMPVALSVGNGLRGGYDSIYDGVLSGSGSLIKVGKASFTLRGENTYTGITTVLGGTLDVTGSLANNGSDKIFVAANGTSFGGTISRKVGIDANYAGFGSTAIGDDALGSAADLIDGTNTGTAKSLSMQWRLRGEDDLAAGLASDVLNLSGMTNEGSQTDQFTLLMSYSVDALPGGADAEAALAAAGKIQLVWYNDTDELWQNAALGNVGDGNEVLFMGVGSSNDGTLGHWGIDTDSHKVWAVLDHNSQFAVAVPEPGTLALLIGALLALSVFGVRRLDAAVVGDRRR